MERRFITEAETKLVILYAMNRLGPVTSMQLLQFLVEYDLMNYFTMQLSLAEMEEQGQVTQHAHPLGSLLLVTQSGAYTLGVFDHRIPISRRELIDREAPAWHARFRAEQQTPADSYPLSGGGTCIRLRLMEGDDSLLDLLLQLPDEASFTFLQKRWRSAAQGVYEAITLTLSGDYDPAAPSAPLPAVATLSKAGHGDWLLSLCDAPDDPTMTLMLSLPDEHLARHYAAAWPDRGEALRTSILRQLQEAETKQS